MIYPGSYPITIYRKSTFDMVVRFKAGGVLLDLNGYVVVAQLWDAKGEYVVDSFQISYNPDLTTGEVTLMLNASQTEALTAGGLYDVKLIEPDGAEYYWLRGRYAVKQGLSDI